MTIAVEFEIRQEKSSTKDWLQVWGIRAQDALDHESYTTSYEAAISNKDPNRVLVFERYEGGEASLHKHMERPAHAALMDSMQSGRMTRRRPWIAMGHESSTDGWWVAESNRDSIIGEGNIIVVVAINSPNPDEAINVFQSCVDKEVKETEGLVLYGTSTVTVEDRKDFNLGYDSIILSMVFSDEFAYASFQSGDCWTGVKSQIEQLGGEFLFERDYTTSGAGFTWRASTAFRQP